MIDLHLIINARMQEADDCSSDRALSSSSIYSAPTPF
jgi:hypothetical protein